MDENKISQNKKLVLSLTGILVLFIVAYSIYYIWYKKGDTYKLDQRLMELKRLETESAPVTKTPEEIIKDLQKLEKLSQPVK